MKFFFVIMTVLMGTNAFANDFRITALNCKTEFNTGLYRKNLLGKLKKKGERSITLYTFEDAIQVNRDGSPFSTGSSYSDGTDRLSTLFKTKKDGHGNVNVAINFRAQGSDVVPRIDFVLGPDSTEPTIYEKSETIELEKPLMWKDEGRNRIMIESVFYACSAILELKTPPKI